MNDKPGLSRPLSPTVQRVADNLKMVGNISFWFQLVLGVVSAVILLLAGAGAQNDVSQGIGFGLFSAACGLVALAIAIYFAFRYTVIAKQLRNPDTKNRPEKKETLRVIKIGLIVNLTGMLLTIVGAEAIVGIVLDKSLKIPSSGLSTIDPSKLVSSIDLLVIQANINTIFAHFSGIVSSLFLLNRISR